MAYDVTYKVSWADSMIEKILFQDKAQNPERFILKDDDGFILLDDDSRILI